MPDIIVKLLAPVSPQMAMAHSELGRERLVDSSKAPRLGWQPRPTEQTIIDTATRSRPKTRSARSYRPPELITVKSDQPSRLRNHHRAPVFNTSAKQIGALAESGVGPRDRCGAPVGSRIVFDEAVVRASGMLAVGDGHEIFWEESGTSSGIPALYLHGGPGGTLGRGGYRDKFDPSRFRIIGLDQRGCGRSTPHVTAPGYDLNQNTMTQLIGDLEQLRNHLNIDRWLINGVSWGSTLALAYAQAHPDRCLGIVAVAVTTTDRFQVDWITETVGAIFPEAWDRLAQHAEEAGIGYRRGQGRVIEAYAQLMTHPDRAVRDAASLAWVEWEDHHISIGAGLHRNPRWDDTEFRHVFATLVTHYWAHDGFLAPSILERMDRLAGVPGTLIHGRRDVSGPAVVPWQLHQAWPASELIIDESEGHGGDNMIEAWRVANNRHADRIKRPS